MNDNFKTIDRNCELVTIIKDTWQNNQIVDTSECVSFVFLRKFTHTAPIRVWVNKLKMLDCGICNKIDNFFVLWFFMAA